MDTSNLQQPSEGPLETSSFLQRASMKNWKILCAIIVLLVILTIGEFAGSIFTRKVTPINTDQNQTTLPVSQEQTPEVVIISAEVDWLAEPQKVSSVGFFTLIDRYFPYKLEYCKSGTDCSKLSEMSDTYEPKTTYYQIGTMRSPYEGSQLYLAITKNLPITRVYKGIGTENDIVYDYEMVTIFIKTPDNKFIVSKDYDNGLILCRGGCMPDQLPPSNNTAGIIYNPNLSLDKIGSYYEYTEPTTGVKFRTNRTNNFLNKTGLFLVKDSGNGYAIYSNQDVTSDLVKLKNIINPTVVVKSPTGLVADTFIDSYSYKFVYKKGTGDYALSSDAQQLLWTANEKPLPLPNEPTNKGIVTDYSAISYTRDFDGCRGNMTLENSFSDSETFNTDEDLVQVATGSNGDTLYDLKSKDFKIFQQFWHWKVVLNGLESMTYHDYLALKPILVVKDKLGVYRMVFREDLVSSKCWAEPLLYLYPEKQTDVQIVLSEIIKLTETEPHYMTSWNVTAYPDGKIYEKTANRFYPYLYWEGSAPIPADPVLMNVVKKEAVHAYLEETLTKLGLNTQEKADFEKYWEPLLKDSPYYLLTFYDATELDKIAPLDVMPKPDTTIRVLMTFERLRNDIKVNYERDYQTPQRTGFTIVEWGGILSKINK